MSTAFNSFTTNLGKEINLSSDTLGVVLTNIAPSKTLNTVLGDITQIANGNGYVTDGPNVAIISWGDADVAGVAELVNNPVTIQAVGGSIKLGSRLSHPRSTRVGPLLGPSR